MTSHVGSIYCPRGILLHDKTCLVNSSLLEWIMKTLQSALTKAHCPCVFALCLAVWLCLFVHSFWEVGSSSWERRGLRWNSLTTLILVSYFPFILTFNIAFSYSVKVLRTSDLYSPVWIFITSDLYKKGFQFLIHLSSLKPIIFQLIVNLDKQDDLFLVDFQGTSTVHNLRLENSVVSGQIKKK